MKYQSIPEKTKRRLLKQKRRYYIRNLFVASTIMICILGLTTESRSADTADMGSDKPAGISFPTFNRTGLDICTDDEGRPVILLFSSETCSHCEWAGNIFDFIVRYYQANGLIEAHHYDVRTGDDHLTEEIETEIPEKHLQIKQHGDPKGYVPYFNFSCKYERIGNGYEKEGDLAAEGEEIRQVIEALIHRNDTASSGVQ